MDGIDVAIKAFFALKKEVGDVKIVLASKTIKTDFLLEFISKTGHLSYGENYASELSKWDAILEKFPNLDLSFIGSFQSGNLRKIIKYCNAIEGVCSIKSFEKIQAESVKRGKKIQTYAQINIGHEKQKNGFLPKEITIEDLKKFDGLMCIPPSGLPDEYFKEMQDLKAKTGLKHLSMGMSRDYKKAILYGSTEIRVGSLIFGERKNI